MDYRALLVLIVVVGTLVGLEYYMHHSSSVALTEATVLAEFDKVYTMNTIFQANQPNPAFIQYNFFTDLEQAYSVCAGNAIHLYADSTRWAFVFEQCAYNTRGFNADIQLLYIGNCCSQVEERYGQYTYTSNLQSIELISNEEFERIQNNTGLRMEQFEHISPTADSVHIRSMSLPIEQNPEEYQAKGITLDSSKNPRRLIGYGELLRYICATNPLAVKASEADIRQYIPGDLPKLMTIDAFHHYSIYNKSILPSKQELYQLIAKIISSRNPALWKPTQPANNHWSNWVSGNL